LIFQRKYFQSPGICFPGLFKRNKKEKKEKTKKEIIKERRKI